MRRSGLSSTILLSLLATAAVATPAFSQAYVAAPAAAVVAVPASTLWTGFYLGGNLGGSFGDKSRTSYIQQSLNQTFTERGDTSGFSGGGQIGYNFRIGTFVFGLEADAQTISIRERSNLSSSTFTPGSPAIAAIPATPAVPAVAGNPLVCRASLGPTPVDFTAPPFTPANPSPIQATTEAQCAALVAPGGPLAPLVGVPGFTFTNTPPTPGSPAIPGTPGVAGVPEVASVTRTVQQSFTGKLDWFGTVRARAGFTPWDNVLVYATGGLAYGDAQLTYSSTITTTTTLSTGSSTTVDAFSQSKHKFLVGPAAGLGIEYALTTNVSVKGEYLYVGLGREGIAGQQVSFNVNVVRAGVNVRF